MVKALRATLFAFASSGLFLGVGCGSSDSGGSPAQHLGVGSECTSDSQCPMVGSVVLHCLTTFKGGYCGLAGCTKDADCPGGSLCVTEVATNYCFLACTDKPSCNLGRSTTYEANCSSSIVFVDGKASQKVCIPPT